MTRLIKTVLISIIALATITTTMHAANGDKINVLSHDQRFVITDPSTGYNAYPAWVVFPSDSTSYRKVMLNITYECPDGLHCGEWDYIDHVFLRKSGTDATDSVNIELARMISPYGWRFDSTWSFTWNVDITDFSLLLHDSVLIEFVHTGYESSEDRGWIVTLDFEITEGRPAVEIFAMDTLWCGSFPYGNNAEPIEELLKPIEFNPNGAEMVRLRIHQTGHGMDSYENCAEFCKKYRRVHFDGKLVDWRELWRECGDNPLSPQAGTWIFDRANWCPGQVVYPDDIDYLIEIDTIHTVDIEMQHYLNLDEPSANWAIYSYLFYAKKPWAKNDASLEQILIPSETDQNSRINPACARPVIQIKNSGSDTLTSVQVYYGPEGGVSLMYEWRGKLSPQESTVITLPGEIGQLPAEIPYLISLARPNNVEDEYPLDNKLEAQVAAPPGLPGEFNVSFNTNNEPASNSYQLLDADGSIIGGRAMGTLEPNTAYLDGYELDPGCYELILADTSGDGLELWFNTEGGFGSFRLLDKDMRLLKAFDSDCGSGFGWWFTVGAGETLESDPTPQVNVFPPRNDGMFSLYLFYNDSADVKVTIESDSLGTVFNESFGKVKEDSFEINLSSQPDGRYIVNVTANGETVTRPIRIRHTN